jgi:hypothetical protein
MGEGDFYVRAMDRIPPPAPAKACATLSDCWAAAVVLVVEDMLILLADLEW